ncbi:glycosyltransferase family 4 protein [Candidatus Nomurabacteria bacterium]|nr:glycosyltransferase family 4 protein [Candidatus Nomurabacteria bacterium]
MRYVFESSRLTQTMTGVGYYAAYLSEELQRISGSEQVRCGFRDAKSDRNTLVTRRVAYKLLAFNIRLPFQLLWGTGYKAAIFPDFNGFGNWSKKTKTAVVVHDTEFITNPSSLDNKRQGLMSYLLPTGSDYLCRTVPGSMRRADIVITTSATVKEEFVRLLNIDSSKIVVTGIPPHPIYAPSANRPVLPLNLKSRKFIYYQATIEPRKNHMNLLKAYELLPNKISSRYPLVLGGGYGWGNRQFFSYINKLKEKGYMIYHLGYVDEATKLVMYQNAAIYVQPSLNEGFGMPILEAMACDTPTVVSDIPVFREVCRKASIYFDPKSSEAIKEAIQTTLLDKNLLKELVKKGRSRVDSYRKDDSGFKEIVERLGI